MLTYCAGRGYVPMVSKLLSCKANPNLQDKVPLSCFCHRFLCAFIRLLSRLTHAHTHAHAHTQYEQTALVAAVCLCKKEDVTLTVEMLLAGKADATIVDDVCLCSRWILRLCLRLRLCVCSCVRARVCVQDKSTALILAAERGYRGAVSAILARLNELGDHSHIDYKIPVCFFV